MLGISEKNLKSKKCINTACEIAQQPKCWKEILELYNKKREEVNSFLKKIDLKNRTVIFSGAGTSEYIGDAIYLYVQKQGIDAISIPSTSFVTNPELYLKKDKNYLIVSFARSGNSPESLGVLNLAKKLIKNEDQLAFLTITCDKNGRLAEEVITYKNSLLYLLPISTNDKSFAMTSSYSSMLISAILILSNDSNHLIQNIENIIPNGINIINNIYYQISEIADKKFNRIIYLGANTLEQYAKEANLKMLELTQGKVISVSNSPVGFRHGPKSIINSNSVVVVFLSTNEFTRKYDFDLVKEIYNDKKVSQLIIFDYQNDPAIAKYCNTYITIGSKETADDVLVGLQYVIISQILALYKSIKLGFSPDNPCPSGEVNRVVKGVKIYLK